MKPTREQLIECFDCVFASTHSEGFKESEMKDLLYDSEYRFLERPKEGWLEALTLKLKEFGFDLDVLISDSVIWKK